LKITTFVVGQDALIENYSDEQASFSIWFVGYYLAFWAEFYIMKSKFFLSKTLGH